MARFFKQRANSVIIFSIALLTAFLLSCDRVPKTASATEPLKIHTYASPGPLNHSCNTHWVETDEGIVVIDTQWVLSEAKKALEQIQQTKKPLLGIFITHAHSDHFGGINAFVEAAGDKVPIYASAITLTSMRNDSQGFIALRQKAFGDDFPKQIALPNRIVNNGDAIKFGNTTFRVLELPHNEALATTMLYLPQQNVLFAGDLVYNQRTPILREGMTALENWLQQLENLRKQYPNLKTIYPGHGNPAPAQQLIAAQIEYLKAFQDLTVEEILPNGAIATAQKKAIVAEIERRFPDYKPVIGLSREQILEQNLDWLTGQLAKR